MYELSDDSIIENTPEKKKIKKCVLRKKKAKNLEDDSSRLLKELVEEFEKNLSQEAGTSSRLTSKQSDTETGYSSLTSNVQDNAKPKSTTAPERKHVGLTEPIQKPFSKNSHKLHVFYQIREVLNFSPNNFPKNSHMHLVGVVDYCDETKSFILSSMELINFKWAEIKIDLRELPVAPCLGDEILLFGVLTFQEQTPIVVAKFFQKFTVKFSTYLKLILKLRPTIPLENFEMICINDAAMNDDESMVQETEDVSNSNLEAQLENSESHQLSDSTLYAFLNEISFEKL